MDILRRDQSMGLSGSAHFCDWLDRWSYCRVEQSGLVLEQDYNFKPGCRSGKAARGKFYQELIEAGTQQAG